MGGDWLETTLGEVLELKRGYDLPKSKRVLGRVPVISSSGESDRHVEAKVAGPGVVTGRYGTIGEVYFTEEPYWPLNTTLYVRDFKGNDEKFVYYFLKTIDYLQFSDKAAVPGVNRNHLHTAAVRVPKSIAEQKAIAHILGTLDDKIELNRQMNATLEAMAQALFKSWFVDFDPVIDNALAAGNPIPEPLQARAAARAALGDQRKAVPTGRDARVSREAGSRERSAEIQQHFPDRFVFSEEMGWVPEGWEAVSVTDMVESISDTYPLKQVRQVIFLNTGDILDGRFLHSDYSEVAGLPGQAKKSIQRGDILYSEIRPKNKRFAYVDFAADGYVVSTKLMVLRSKGVFDPLFVYFILKQGHVIDYLQHIAESRSGTFPQITFKQLDQIKFVLPREKYLVDFFVTRQLQPNQQKSRNLISESSSLERIRDTLLPKLLSGELRMPDAEKQLAEAL